VGSGDSTSLVTTTIYKTATQDHTVTAVCILIISMIDLRLTDIDRVRRWCRDH
jgi:hypothetical protein